MGKYKGLTLLLLLVLPSLTFASDTAVPEVVSNFGEVIKNMLTSVFGLIAIVVVFILAGIEVYRNGTATPAKWALFGSMLIGGAILLGPKLMEAMQTALS